MIGCGKDTTVAVKLKYGTLMLKCGTSITLTDDRRDYEFKKTFWCEKCDLFTHEDHEKE